MSPTWSMIAAISAIAAVLSAYLAGLHHGRLLSRPPADAPRLAELPVDGEGPPYHVP